MFLSVVLVVASLRKSDARTHILFCMDKLCSYSNFLEFVMPTSSSTVLS